MFNGDFWPQVFNAHWPIRSFVRSIVRLFARPNNTMENDESVAKSNVCVQGRVIRKRSINSIQSDLKIRCMKTGILDIFCFNFIFVS